MHLSRIRILNFRNFQALDVVLVGNVVVVGENRVGKSNLLYALRLLLDPSLPDSARQLTRGDFCDHLGEPLENERITVSVELRDFDSDMDLLAVVTDFRLDDDPEIVRLTYEFRPVAGLENFPTTADEYEFVCYGGESDAKRFGHDLRRRISMDLLPALRDAETDLSTWRRSPLRPLIERALADVPRSDLDAVQADIGAATTRLGEFEAVLQLQENLSERYVAMSGATQDIAPTLGMGITDVTRLYRNVRLLIDGGLRSIGEASLGSANVAFLTLKILELEQLMLENRRDHSVLAIEEPEAHLHPHLQRSVYKHLFEEFGADNAALTMFLTTHSPHIASVAPLRSLLLLRATASGAVGRSAASLELTDAEEEDLQRYLDVTRAEMLFARGILLVEGDAEKYLVPGFAMAMGVDLDRVGITVCSVSGINFQPYAKFLTALQIPFAVVTDWDPLDGERLPLGYNRTLELVRSIEKLRLGRNPIALVRELKEIEEYSPFCRRCEDYGIFSNNHTLEVDLFSGNFIAPILATMREDGLSETRTGWVNGWETDASTLNPVHYLKIIDAMGKGRFAQRLASRVEGFRPPPYIARAIQFVASRV